MERVQFQLESTLPELKDLHEKGLFSKSEIDSITRRRTQFESALIGKGLKKEDYFKYAEYEIGLEKLRKVRWKRLGYDRNPPPPSASTYSLPRRISYILKRATAKFPGDIATWLAYVEYAGTQGMRKVVTRGLTSALQHHPLSPTLYLLSAYHHLHPGSPFPRSAIPSSSANPLPLTSDTIHTQEDDAVNFALEGTQPARTTILLGLRLLPKNESLWLEYIKLELGWVEALRRRWRVLGISESAQGVNGESRPLGDLEAGEGSFGPEGEDARKAILSGQLVRHAIISALKAIPLGPGLESLPDRTGLEFRKTIVALLRVYPSPLRLSLLDEVYQEIARMTGDGTTGDKGSAAAQLILVTRRLYDREYQVGIKDDGGVILDGVDLVDAIGQIGRDIKASAAKLGSAFGEEAGSWIIDWLRKNTEQVELSTYLLSVLASLVNRKALPSDQLITLYLQAVTSMTMEGQDRLRAINKLASTWPHHAELQRRRFDLIVSMPATSVDDVRKIATEATAALGNTAGSSDSTHLQAIWEVWLDWELRHIPNGSQRQASVTDTFSQFIKRSAKTSAARTIQPQIMIKWIDSAVTHSGSCTPPAVLAELRRILGHTHLPCPAFFEHVMATLSTRCSPPADVKTLMAVYEQWRARCGDTEERLQAGLSLLAALVRVGHAARATKVYETLRREFRDDMVQTGNLEMAWKGLVDRESSDSDEEERSSDLD